MQYDLSDCKRRKGITSSDRLSFKKQVSSSEARGEDPSCRIDEER